MSKPATRRKKREPAPPRKKACEQCIVAKVRCSLGRPACRRCQSRELSCKYLTLTGLEDWPRSNSNRLDAPEFELSVAPGDDLFSSATPVEDLFFDQETGQRPPRQEIQSHSAAFRGQRKKTTGNPTDFSHIDLISVTDSDSIRNRWLQSFLPSTGKRAKILPPHTVQYLSCVFKSYSRRLLRPGCLPPFIHPLQMVDGELPLSLANCFSLVQM
jgi:Fungal Zn(2)-Cys(6) binuclear cluster domain